MSAMRRAVSGWGLAWRAVVSLAVLGAVVDGTWHGKDERWPFAPMSQFAFAVANDGGDVRSQFIEADTVAGTRVRVRLSPDGLGIERSEIEGQLGRFVREPGLLQVVAVAHARREADSPRYAVLYLREQVTRLQGGRPASVVVNTLATWRVPSPADPQELP
jgi:hypothetical protein